MNFFNLFYVFQNTVFEKKLGYKHATITLITQKILVCVWNFDTKTFPRHVIQIQNFQINFQNRKEIFFKLKWILKNQ